MTEGTVDNYRMLAYAIIAQAAVDYMECIKYLLFKGAGKDEIDNLRISWCIGNMHTNEKFFLSPRFDILADKGTDGQALIELLKKRANEDYKGYLKDRDVYLKEMTDNEQFIAKLSRITRNRKKRKRYDQSDNY